MNLFKNQLHPLMRLPYLCTRTGAVWRSSLELSRVGYSDDPI